MHRAVGIPAIAEREVEQTDEPTRELLESFVDGVNRYVDSHQRELPPEFQLGYGPEPFSATRRRRHLARPVVVAQRSPLLAQLGRGGERPARAPARRLPGAGRPTTASCRQARPTRLAQRAQRADGHVRRHGSNNWAIAASAHQRRQRQSCAAIRSSHSGSRRAGTSTPSTAPTTTRRAPASRACLACGGAATARSPGPSPTTPRRRATSTRAGPPDRSQPVPRRRHLASLRGIRRRDRACAVGRGAP